MSKVIEIVVIGATGTGKSNVLAVIDAALREAYGPHTQVVSRELSLDRGLGSPSDKPSADTIFSLREQVSKPAESIGTLVFDIDTSGIDAATAKLKELEEAGERYWASRLDSGSLSAEELQGFTTGYAVDPLESAINNTVSAATDAEGLTLILLQDHLKQLCEIQRTKLSAPLSEEATAALLQEVTNKLQVLTDVTRASMAAP